MLPGGRDATGRTSLFVWLQVQKAKIHTAQWHDMAESSAAKLTFYWSFKAALYMMASSYCSRAASRSPADFLAEIFPMSFVPSYFGGNAPPNRAIVVQLPF